MVRAHDAAGSLTLGLGGDQAAINTEARIAEPDSAEHPGKARVDPLAQPRERRCRARRLCQRNPAERYLSPSLPVLPVTGGKPKRGKVHDGMLPPAGRVAIVTPVPAGTMFELYRAALV